jgi:hypothetical protein
MYDQEHHEALAETIASLAHEQSTVACEFWVDF